MRFMAGHDVWRELAEIYVSLQLYKQVGFCYEELILSLPIIHIHHLAYADVNCGGSAKSGYSIRHGCRISAQKLHDATYRGIVGVSFDVVQYGIIGDHQLCSSDKHYVLIKAFEEHFVQITQAIEEEKIQN
uniref:ER membrane protein complex subunit 2 n=1 Tax=Lactuca sativa TaxID=4236 RepID=A0A9R1VZ57_LACSA|nr:hypothetical protein LSAT_V11C400167800 [Lactuca sativa]